MSFLYPRTIALWRPNQSAAVGDVGFNALRGSAFNQADYTSTFTGISASIQLDRQGQRNGTGLPTDAAYKPIWKIFVPISALALGSIKANDVAVDDLGVAYQIFAPYWNSLGYNARCIVLEV